MWTDKQMDEMYGGVVRNAKQLEAEVEQLRARVADLEAQLAQTWQPVEDEAIGCSCGCSRKLSVGKDGSVVPIGPEPFHAMVLPDNFRFCRQTYG